MENFKKIVIILATAICSSFFYNTANAFPVQETFTPTSIGCFTHGTCYISVDPAATLTECPFKTQIRFDITDPGAETQYLTALTAFTSGKKIKAWVNDTCLDNFPTIDYLQIIH